MNGLAKKGLATAVELQHTFVVATSVELLRNNELLNMRLYKLLHAELLNVVRLNELLNHDALPRYNHALNTLALNNDLLANYNAMPSRGSDS